MSGEDQELSAVKAAAANSSDVPAWRLRRAVGLGPLAAASLLPLKAPPGHPVSHPLSPCFPSTNACCALHCSFYWSQLTTVAWNEDPLLMIVPPPMLVVTLLCTADLTGPS